MTGSALGRLRRLPWWVAGWLTAITAIGVLILSLLAIRADAQRGDAVLDAQTREVTAAVTRLIGYDGTVVTTLIGRDEVNTGCPEFAVLPGATEPFTGHFSRRDCVPVDNGVQARLAAEAVSSGRELYGYITDADGNRAWVRAEPFRNTSGQYVGAVVALVDPGAVQAAHRTFRRYVIGGALLLLGVVAAAAYLLTVRGSSSVRWAGCCRAVSASARSAATGVRRSCAVSASSTSCCSRAALAGRTARSVNR